MLINTFMPYPSIIDSLVLEAGDFFFDLRANNKIVAMNALN